MRKAKTKTLKASALKVFRRKKRATAQSARGAFNRRAAR
jgi:hypothetical protein